MVCSSCQSDRPTLPDPRWRRALWIALAVNAPTFATELAAGIAAEPRSLQADALDFLGDADGYAISGTAWPDLVVAMVVAVLGIWGGLQNLTLVRVELAPDGPGDAKEAQC